MKNKANDDKYHNFTDFKKDLQQIVWNCLRFNAGNDYFLKTADRFDKDYKKVLEKYEEKIGEVLEVAKNQDIEEKVEEQRQEKG